jgi:hypothetical protein
MSYVQCKNDEEVEKVLTEKGGQGFVTEDFRVYDKITFGDDALLYDFDAEMVRALNDLKGSIELLGDDACEASFLTLEEDAKRATADYKKVQALLGGKGKSPKEERSLGSSYSISPANMAVYEEALIPAYQDNPVATASLCDDVLDPSGARLGRIRDAARRRRLHD